MVRGATRSKPQFLTRRRHWTAIPPKWARSPRGAIHSSQRQFHAGVRRSRRDCWRQHSTRTWWRGGFARALYARGRGSGRGRSDADGERRQCRRDSARSARLRRRPGVTEKYACCGASLRPSGISIRMDRLWLRSQSRHGFRISGSCAPCWPRASILAFRFGSSCRVIVGT